MPKDISAFQTRQQMVCSTFEIYHYREPYFKAPDFHGHDFYELYFFLDGGVTYHMEEKVYELQPGDVMLIPPGKMHRPVIVEDKAVYERVVLWINRGFFHALEEGGTQPLHLFDEAEAGRSYQLHLPEKEKEQVLDLLNSLIAEEQNDTFGRQDAQKALLTLLLITLARRQKNSKRDVQSQGEEGLVPGVIRYINAHLEGDLSLDTLSQLFFISKYHLIREFKRYTNTTVYEYILLKRVVLAKKLMAQGATAEEACRGSGFSDYSNFYKTFTRRARMTPREYKNHCLNE